MGLQRSEEHTSELQSHSDLVCRLLLEKKKTRGDRLAILASQHGHSLSPAAAYEALGLTDWTYDALDIGADDLPVLLSVFFEECGELPDTNPFPTRRSSD